MWPVSNAATGGTGKPEPEGIDEPWYEPVSRRALSVDACVDGVRAGDRAMLGRAITLVESTRADHQTQAREVLGRLLPDTGDAVRIGISGSPGVGKSTFIEAFGTLLTGRGHRVAVLAVAAGRMTVSAAAHRILGALGTRGPS